MIVSVIGARPQFIKAAVVSKALKKYGIDEKIVHTGQHYDDRMSTVFWEELNLPSVHINLETGSGTQGAQTARIIEKLEAFLLSLPETPKAVLLYGDTNSTLAGSIVASKLQIPIIHVEAGLRSFNRAMPEEINRIVTDHLSAMLFCSSGKGVGQLAAEGITENVYDAGDVMYDAINIFREVAAKEVRLENLLPFAERQFCVLTLHRPSNTDDPANLASILQAIGKTGIPVLWPLHPRLKEKITRLAIPENIHVVAPFSYFEMLCALQNCFKVFTDSGGLQKEAYWMKKPCITLRNETEWVETAHDNWNMLTGADEARITCAFHQTIDPATWYPLYGDSTASEKIAKTIRDHLYT